MPSAANVKVDKQISSAENALADTGNSAMNPLRQAIIIIEHKIRNLEKRKVSDIICVSLCAFHLHRKFEYMAEFFVLHVF